MKWSLAPIFASVAALLLAGCGMGSGADYPSLAVRSYERPSGSAPLRPPEPRPLPPEAASPELLERIARLQGEARAAQSDFAGLVPRATRLADAARGASFASERATVAYVAIGDLTVHLGEAQVALGELDALFTSDVEDDQDAPAALVAARAEVQRIVESMDARVDALASRLP